MITPDDVECLLSILRARSKSVKTADFLRIHEENDLRPGHLVIKGTREEPVCDAFPWPMTSVLNDRQWAKAKNYVHSVTLWNFTLRKEDEEWFKNAKIKVVCKFTDKDSW